MKRTLNRNEIVALKNIEIAVKDNIITLENELEATKHMINTALKKVGEGYYVSNFAKDKLIHINDMVTQYKKNLRMVMKLDKMSIVDIENAYIEIVNTNKFILSAREMINAVKEEELIAKINENTTN